MKKLLILTSLLAIVLVQNACKQEYLNPAVATEQQVINSADGLITLCNGLQFRYTTTRVGVLYNAVAAGGLAGRELRVLNAGNTDELNLEQGFANVQGSNAVVRNLWATSQVVRSNADVVLTNADRIGFQSANVKNGVVAYASIFKALSLGTLAQFFEQTPVTTGTNAPFVSRVQALSVAVQQLEAAATAVSSASVAADLTSNRFVPGIDIPNTLQALIARYSLFAGDYDKALAAAGRVDLTKRSFFSFDDNSRNPVFETAFSNVNVFAPVNATLNLLGDVAPNPADKRLAFYVRANPSASQNLGTGFYTANNAPIPVYLPGEMLLIRAEAYARKGDLPNAIAELNKVLTKTTDVWGLGAGLPAYSGPQITEAVLTEIYRNRAIELAFQGFRLEDSRRLGRSGPGGSVPNASVERTRNFLPYPFTESDNNPNTPTNVVN